MFSEDGSSICDTGTEVQSANVAIEFAEEFTEELTRGGESLV